MHDPPLDFRLPLVPALRESTPSAVAIAKYIAARMEPNVVSVAGTFYDWTGTRWRVLPTNVMQRFVHGLDQLVVGKEGKRYRLEGGGANIVKLLHEMLSEPDFFKAPAQGINVANGFIGFGEHGDAFLLPHDREQRQRHVIDADYIADVDELQPPRLYSKLVDGIFKGDADAAAKHEVIDEILAAAVLGLGPGLKEPKAVVLYGPSAENGKSQVLDMLRAFLPPAAVASIPIATFSDKHALIELDGKLLNAVDELGSAELLASDKFKAVITGNPVQGRRAAGETRWITPRAMHVFACNKLPRFRDGMDPAIRRRLLVIEFNRKIPKDERVKRIGTQVVADRDDRNLILWLAVEAAKRLLTQGFTEPPSSAAALDRWAQDADIVIGFLDDPEWVRAEDDAFTTTRDLYTALRTWAKEKGQREVPGEREFVQRVEQTGRATRKSNGQVRGLIGLRLVHV